MPRKRRRYFLSELNPAWATSREHGTCFLIFDCPEGHDGCDHKIQFTPNLEGKRLPNIKPIWTRQQGIQISFENLTLTETIKCVPQYTSLEAARLQRPGLVYLHPSLLCGFHGFIQDGRIIFCDDSQ